MSDEYDPTKIYEVSRVIPDRLRAHHPEYADMERQRLAREIAPYPGILFIYEDESEAMGALIVRYQKVPPDVAQRRKARAKAQRDAERGRR